MVEIQTNVQQPPVDAGGLPKGRVIALIVAGAVAALAGSYGVTLAYKSLGQSSSTAAKTPQAIVESSRAGGHDLVVRLSNRDISDAALKVASLDPLADLDDQVSVASSLAEMGQFAPADPAFTFKILAPDIDTAMQSLQEAYTELAPNDAQALDFAVRFLAVTKLKGSDFAAYGQDPTAIPDSALFKHILPLINGRTPMQIMVTARNEQIRIDEQRQEMPADPFDRIEMQRSGQMPGMTFPR